MRRIRRVGVPERPGAGRAEHFGWRLAQIGEAPRQQRELCLVPLMLVVVLREDVAGGLDAALGLEMVGAQPGCQQCRRAGEAGPLSGALGRDGEIGGALAGCGEFNLGQGVRRGVIDQVGCVDLGAKGLVGRSFSRGGQGQGVARIVQVVGLGAGGWIGAEQGLVQDGDERGDGQGVVHREGRRVLDRLGKPG